MIPSTKVVGLNGDFSIEQLKEILTVAEANDSQNVCCGRKLASFDSMPLHCGGKLGEKCRDCGGLYFLSFENAM